MTGEVSFNETWQAAGHHFHGGNPLDFKDSTEVTIGNLTFREAQEGQLDLHTMKQGMGFVPQAGGGLLEDR